MSKRRTFSEETKLSILKEAREKGVFLTLSKYGIYPVTYYSWKNKYILENTEVEQMKNPGNLKEVKRLEKENNLLKKLLAEKELDAHLKEVLLKKERS